MSGGLRQEGAATLTYVIEAPADSDTMEMSRRMSPPLDESMVNMMLQGNRKPPKHGTWTLS